MNPIVKLIGKCYLLIRKCGDYVERKEYEKKLMKCGKEFYIGSGCNIIPEHISVGDHVSIGNNAWITTSISHVYIGNHVVMGPNVTIRGGDHRIDIVGRYIDTVTESEKLPENDQDVIIEDDVWIGGNVIILKGVTIGEGAVIGAGSVVTKNVPPYTIHVGVHAPYEKRRFTDAEIIEHKRIIKLEKEK